MSHHFKIKLAGRKGFKFATLEELPRYTCCGEPTIAEQLAEIIAENDKAYGEEREEPVQVEWYREVTQGRTVPIGCVALAVLSVDRAYGGPEEGGWYYDAESLVREFIVPRAYERRAREILERYCEAISPPRGRRYNDGWYTVRRDWTPRETRPHYC